MEFLGSGNPARRLRLMLAALIGLFAPALAAAQQGTITGRITQAGAGTPISDVRVYVVGTNAATATNADGRYTLRTAPGTVDLRVLRIGYQEQKRSVTVPAGGTVTADFSMTMSLVTLTEVVFV